jgi:hypothetical protein
MKLIQFREPGPPEVMQCLNVPVPKPKNGEVLVRAHAIGVGMPDILIRNGSYGYMPPLPATPGTEMAGTIEKLGTGVISRRLGQRVYASARERPHRGGHYAEYVVTPAEATFVLPDGVDLDAAAALANYQVAYHIFNDAVRPRAGESVLIYAAASAPITPSTAPANRWRSACTPSPADAASTSSSIRSAAAAFPTTSRFWRRAARWWCTAGSAERPSTTCSRRCAPARIRRLCASSPSTPGTTSSTNAVPACAR